MTAAEILATSGARGFQISLNSSGDDPPPDLVDLVRGAKPQIVAVLQNERGRINHWIADRLIDWPPESCLHCRKPIIVGQAWIVVSNGEVTARFHEPCHAEWLEQQEAAARRVLGLAA
jgi:hypothetical protein